MFFYICFIGICAVEYNPLFVSDIYIYKYQNTLFQFICKSNVSCGVDVIVNTNVIHLSHSFLPSISIVDVPTATVLF